MCVVCDVGVVWVLCVCSSCWKLVGNETNKTLPYVLWDLYFNGPHST